MVVRLISTIIVLVVIAFFAGFNLENKCDVNLLFYTFKNAPVFFTIIFSFVAGIIFTLPFAFFSRGKKKNGAAQGKTVAPAGAEKKDKKHAALFHKSRAAGKNTDDSLKNPEHAEEKSVSAHAENAVQEERVSSEPSAESSEQNGSKS